MSIIATAVRHLIAAGVTGEALVLAIEEMEAAMAPAAAEPSLTPRQARNRRYYEARKARADDGGERLKASEKRLKASYSDAPSLPPEVSPHTPLPNPHPIHPPSPPKGGSSPAEPRPERPSARRFEPSDAEVEPINLKPFAKLLRIVATSGMTFDQAVQAAWAVQPIVDGRRRSARADVHRAFVGVLRRGAMPAEALAGLRAYYALPASTKDGGQFASGAAVILNRDRWREFLPAPEAPPAPVSAAVEAHRLAHWRRTGEWKREWGERPKEAA